VRFSFFLRAFNVAEQDAGERGGVNRFETTDEHR